MKGHNHILTFLWGLEYPEINQLPQGKLNRLRCHLLAYFRGYIPTPLPHDQDKDLARELILEWIPVKE